MKKIFIVLLVLALGISSEVKTQSASIQSFAAIGKGVNVVKSSHASPETPLYGGEIFSSNFLDDQSLLMEVPLNTIEISENEGFSLNEYYNTSSINYSVQTGISGTYKIFNGTFKSNFTSSIAKEDYRKMGQYYFTKSIIKKDKGFYIKDYLGNKEQFKNNLSATFLSNLSKLNSGLMTYDSFFESYGTHFIAHGFVGGRLDINYAVTSSETSFSVSNKNEIKTYVKAGIQYTQESADLSTSLNTSVLTGGLASQIEVSYKAVAVGGLEFSKLSPGNMSSDYSTWINSVSTSPVLVGYGYNGLVPYWEIIPDNFVNVRSQMKQMFENYATDYDVNFISNSSAIFESNSTRTTTYLINDKGRFVHNKYDVIKWSSWGSGLTQNWLANNGLTRVIINIKLDVSEVDDGEEYIFIYKDKVQRGDEIALIDFEHGGSVKYTDWLTHTFEFDLPLSAFDDGFAIRYGAKGIGNDDWKNKNLKVTLIFY